MKKQKESRLVGTVTPAVPVWLVYKKNNGEIFTDPVMFYTVWENYLEDGTPCPEFRAVPFSGAFLEEDDLGMPHHSNNLLGQSLTAEVKPADWGKKD